MSEYKQGVNSRFEEILLYDFDKLVNSDSHVEGALTKGKSRVELAGIVYLSLIFIKLIGIKLAPLLVGNGVKETVLLLDEGDLLADIRDAERFVEFFGGLSCAYVRASPDSCA